MSVDACGGVGGLERLQKQELQEVQDHVVPFRFVSFCNRLVFWLAGAYYSGLELHVWLSHKHMKTCIWTRFLISMCQFITTLGLRWPSPCKESNSKLFVGWVPKRTKSTYTLVFGLDLQYFLYILTISESWKCKTISFLHNIMLYMLMARNT